MKQNILIIDDEESIRKNLRRFLLSAGYSVTVAANGNEALKILGQMQPDMVITDVFMPEKDGLEVIRHLRQQSPEVKIIAMSGGSPRMPRSMLPVAGSMGADRTFSKPFELPTLLAAIRDLLPPRQVDPPASPPPPS